MRLCRLHASYRRECTIFIGEWATYYISEFITCATRSRGVRSIVHIARSCDRECVRCAERGRLKIEFFFAATRTHTHTFGNNILQCAEAHNQKFILYRINRQLSARHVRV